MCGSFFCYERVPQRFLSETPVIWAQCGVFAGSSQAAQSDVIASDVLRGVLG